MSLALRRSRPEAGDQQHHALVGRQVAEPQHGAATAVGAAGHRAAQRLGAGHRTEEPQVQRELRGFQEEDELLQRS